MGLSDTENPSNASFILTVKGGICNLSGFSLQIPQDQEARQRAWSEPAPRGRRSDKTWSCWGGGAGELTCRVSASSCL